MNKLTEVFTPSRVSRGNRHIVKGQIVQGDNYQVEDVRRAFWSNPDGTHSAHLFRLKRGEVVDRVTVDSWEGESLNQFALRTESIISRGCEMTAKEMNDADFVNFQDDFYNLLEKYGVSSIDIEHPQFKSICNLRNKVAEFIEQENFEGVLK
jgi:hypothetical protein